jgi:diguanylate cyclase (GGDEF)-like protein/PAS domain S-box-containing protein
MTDRILIVEDEKIISLDLKLRIERFGYTVVGTTTTGEEAIELAEKLRPDLILMDIMLAGELDGVETATTIQEQHDIPVIYLTAYSDEGTVERAQSTDPFGFVLKPFKERELYTTIKVAIHKSRADRNVARSERRITAVLDSVGEAIIATNAEGRIEFMNPVSEKLIGLTESEARGLPIGEAVRLYDCRSELEIPLPEVKTFAGQQEPLYFDDACLEGPKGAWIPISGNITRIGAVGEDNQGLVIAFRDLSEVKTLTRDLTYTASHDTLTGLLNREEFFSVLQTAVDTALREDRVHAYFYVDLDQFKLINDVCGHIAGDELLRQIAAEIADHSGHEHEGARLGGDEFGIIVYDVGLDEAAVLGNNLRRQIERKFVWQRHAFQVTASIGVVAVSGLTEDIYHILAAADDACYLAKEDGGNALRVYANADYSFLKRRGEMQWISRLSKSIEEDRFALYFQEIQAVRDPRETKREILLRLIDGDGELVGPANFIPAAEKYRLMPSLDRWVIDKVLAVLARQPGNGARPPVYCINVSGSSVADDDFLAFVRQVFDRHGADPAGICFEITETAAIQNQSKAVSFMAAVRNLGATFALDDFGNGFSSFAYLKNLPVDFLKIDGSFVKNVASSTVDRVMVEAVNNIGHAHGMKTIAEFVTDKHVRSVLEEIGVDYLQGYEVSRPTPLLTGSLESGTLH